VAIVRRDAMSKGFELMATGAGVLLRLHRRI
jgi:hypothetical protein